MTLRWPAAVAGGLMLAMTPTGAFAHEGPPFPIVSDRAAGPYVVSIWTDPDTTDDGTPGGQFWVVLHGADGARVPADTRATVSIAPSGGDGPAQAGRAEPVDGDLSRQFIALLMDHEGPYDVQVAVDGPLGPVTIEADVEATYDARPAPALLILYAAPFVLIGALWIKVLLRRRGTAS